MLFPFGVAEEAGGDDVDDQSGEGEDVGGDLGEGEAVDDAVEQHAGGASEGPGPGHFEILEQFLVSGF